MKATTANLSWRRCLLLLIASTASVLGMEITNCYECADLNRGRNYMCQYNGVLPTTDTYAVACCEPDDTSEYCQPSDTNLCSISYNDAVHNFFTFCPRINATGCGIFESGS